MEKYFGDIIAGVVVIILGAAVIAIVKATLKSFIVDMEKIFVTQKICDIKHESEAEERESIRKDVQNHENRLNTAGA